MLEYLTLKPETFGLDISDLSLKIVKLKKKKKLLSLVSFGEKEIKPGVIERGEIKDQDALAETIKDSLNKINGERLKTNYIIASLPEEKAFLRVIQMPIMEEKDLKKAVYFEAENYIPLPLESVYLDSQIIPQFNNKSGRLNVLIVALPKKIIDAYVDVFHKAGLKPTALEVEAQAISRALIEKGKEKCSSLLIDLGTTKTGLTFFSMGSLRFTASLPAVSENSEKGQLVEEIKRHIEYYKNYETSSINRVLLCGGRANLSGLPDFLSRELEIKTSVGNPWINIFSDPPKEIPEISFEDSLKYTTALGLALYDKFTVAPT